MHVIGFSNEQRWIAYEVSYQEDGATATAKLLDEEDYVFLISTSFCDADNAVAHLDELTPGLPMIQVPDLGDVSPMELIEDRSKQCT